MPDGGSFTQEEIDLLLGNIDQLSEAELTELEGIVSELEQRQYAQRCRDNLIAFCCHMQRDYKVGGHHKRLATLLEDIEQRKKDRICVSVPPRHGKSQLVSIYYAAWYLGRNPSHKVMLVSHTTDLAVDFGRKVRNLIASPEFQEIFPSVDVAADNKSAGRWNTNQGGEFFACLDPATPVPTTRGVVSAGEVKLGDHLQSPSGPKEVLSVMETTHAQTVTVAGGRYSAEHPIWTMNRGWVEAVNILPADVLCAESIWDLMKAKLREIKHGLMEHTHVPALVQHKISVPEPEQREVPSLRRARDMLGRALGGLSHVLSGYGGPALSPAYCGPYGQQRPLFSRELPMGDTHRTIKQQAQHRATAGKDFGPACAILGVDARNFAVSDVSRLDRGRGPVPPEEAAEELQTYRDPEGLGWLRCWAACILARSSRYISSGKPRTRFERNMARLRGAAQNLSGLLLGVRPAGDINVEGHEPRTFVNFRISGDNSFFSAGVLTHNCGVGSALAGRGAHLLLIDDPHSEQDILSGNYSVFDKAYEWFAFGARTRLMPGGAVAIVHTRWSPDDLIGRVIKDMANKDADQYEVFEFPAILEAEKTDPETGETTIVEKALWPEFFDLPALYRTKASMPTYQWNAQYQQKPTAEEASIIKREWWRTWREESPPACEYIICSLDAAAEAHNRADYTALTTWGVFLNEDEDAYQLILLDSIKERMEFPALKRLCYDHYKEWEPDAFIVEKKSSGVAVYQEMRRSGIPVSEYTPVRGTTNNPNTKMARLNSVADIVASGMVWVPDRRWAEELVEEIAGFPHARHDDLADATIMALMRFRQGGFIRLPTDDEDDELPYRPRVEYY